MDKMQSVEQLAGDVAKGIISFDQIVEYEIRSSKWIKFNKFPFIKAIATLYYVNISRFKYRRYYESMYIKNLLDIYAGYYEKISGSKPKDQEEDADDAAVDESFAPLTSRSIKFKVWDSNFKRWDGPAIMVTPSNISMQNKIFLQAVGLKDINGVDVFEGDVIKNPNGINWEYSPIIYSELHAAFKAQKEQELNLFDLIKKRDCFVVGNIYENPELQ